MDSTLSRVEGVLGFGCETKWLWDFHDGFSPKPERVPDGNQAVGKDREVQR